MTEISMDPDSLSPDPNVSRPTCAGHGSLVGKCPRVGTEIRFDDRSAHEVLCKQCAAACDDDFRLVTEVE